MKTFLLVSVLALVSCAIETPDLGEAMSAVEVNGVEFDVLLETATVLPDGRTRYDATFLEPCSWTQWLGIQGGEIPGIGVVDALAGYSKPRDFITGMQFKVIIAIPAATP